MVMRKEFKELASRQLLVAYHIVDVSFQMVVFIYGVLQVRYKMVKKTKIREFSKNPLKFHSKVAVVMRMEEISLTEEDLMLKTN